MTKCLLVDDESPAIKLLQNHINLLDDLTVVATCHSAVEAFEILKTQTIDLIFLDIHMPILSGLEFLKTVKNLPKVIITTAYREHAIEGYDLDIIDYLLKPISFDRFIKSIDRYYERVQPNITKENEIIPTEAFFYVNINKKHVKVLFNEISYIESLKDYVKIHLLDRYLVVKSNIGKIYEQLPKHSFLRVHRSFIVNLTQITAFTQKDVEIGQVAIPIGSSYTEEVVGFLKK